LSHFREQLTREQEDDHVSIDREHEEPAEQWRGEAFFDELERGLQHEARPIIWLFQIREKVFSQVGCGDEFGEVNWLTLLVVDCVAWCTSDQK